MRRNRTRGRSHAGCVEPSPAEVLSDIRGSLTILSSFSLASLSLTRPTRTVGSPRNSIGSTRDYHAGQALRLPCANR